MGLFDNPRYFLPATKTVDSDHSKVEVLRLQRAPNIQSTNASTSTTVNETNFGDKTKSTSAISEQSFVNNQYTSFTNPYDEHIITTTSSKRNDKSVQLSSTKLSNETKMCLSIVKIVITLCIGYLVNHAIVFLLAYTIINMRYQVQANEKSDIGQYLYCFQTILSVIYYAILLFCVWKPTKLKLAASALIRFMHIAIILVYPFIVYKQFSIETCQNSNQCVKEMLIICVMSLTDIVLIVLILIERHLIK